MARNTAFASTRSSRVRPRARRSNPVSQHHCDSQRHTRKVRVILGYDRMLSQFFMDVVPLNAKGFAQTDRILYSSGADPSSRRADIEFFREKLDALRVTIPE